MIISEFIIDLIKKLRFPGKIAFDAHGFVQTQKGEPVFIYGSLNSSIDISGKQSIMLQGMKNRKALIEFFSGMTNEQFLEKWFLAHNNVGDLQQSGLTPRRLISLYITFDLSSVSVKDLQ